MFVGYLRHPNRGTWKQNACVDFVVNDYAIAHTSIRIRSGELVQKDLAWVKTQAEQLDATAKVWFDGYWYYV